jgi:lysozyme family protein
MAAEDFDKSLQTVLVYEGGKVDDPADPGGRTNQGITQKVYNSYRRRKGMQQRDVYQLTAPERDEIYRTQYWNMVSGDALPRGVDIVVFDGAVNSGPARSIKWLQSALSVEADGVLGPVTMHAVGQQQDYDALIAEIIGKREAFLHSLKTFKRFGKGWLARTLNVEQIGQAWATGSVGPAPVHVEGASAKAKEDDVKTAPQKGLGDVATGVGVGSGGVAGAVQGLQEQLTPFSMAGGWISKLVIALAILSALLVVGGLLWRWYATRQKAKINEAVQ